MPLEHSPPGKTSYLWALRKTGIIDELNKYGVEFNPTAKLSDLKLTLRDNLVKFRKTASESRTNSCINLLREIETAEQTEKTKLNDHARNLEGEFAKPIHHVEVRVNERTDSTQSTPTLRRSARLNAARSQSYDDIRPLEEDSNEEEEEEILRDIEAELAAKHEEEAKRREREL